jgi:ankyrin repeat protein
LKVAERLLEHNAAILKTQGNETPLHWAASCASIAMVQLLLKFHPEINVYDKNDRNESAVQMTNVQEIRDLLIGTAKFS